MGATNVPHGTAAGSEQTWPAGGIPADAEAGSTGVRERIGDAASQVGEAGRETAHEAKERARDVVHEATDRTRGLVDRTRTELRSQAASQQRHLATGLRALGDELGQMADGAQDPGFATDLVQHAADATGRAAQWFEGREPVDVLHQVEDFARRRPGLFVALAAGAGLLVGRFVRGAKDASDRGTGEERPDPAAHDRTEGGGTPPAVFAPSVPDPAAPQTTGGETFVERP